ncbi:MAG: L-2-hydroxyglutarate oxidase [Myxococcales bacterium]|nr:L-2-hydroxyglutarate oxidase [Myxococcales bacterium]
MEQADVIIIGAGIVGLATAHGLLRERPDLKLCLLEKEEGAAQHQTGHNSGVIHSGIYYRPGSYKARLCRQGKAALERFLDEQGIQYKRRGKVIVAVDPSERLRLEALYQRGIENGVDCTLVGAEQLREIEPHTAGQWAIWVPETGVVDFGVVAARMVDCIVERGGRVVTNARVQRVVEDRDHAVIASTQGEFRARLVINCAGLYSDRLRLEGGRRSSVRILPFRGEYYSLVESRRDLCRSLIYPVPDPALPFLGVHLSRGIDEAVHCGPNAVLAWDREGYRRRNLRLADAWDTLRFGGFWRMAGRYMRVGTQEWWRSWNKNAFVRSLQRLVPDVSGADLERSPAGVRAQAVRPDGHLVDDFLIEEEPFFIHVRNAPSPAATASLAIGQVVGEQALARLDATSALHPSRAAATILQR